MDITNLEVFANCHSNYIDDVVLSSQVMAAKAYVASLAENSVNTNSQTIDLIFFITHSVICRQHIQKY